MTKRPSVVSYELQQRVNVAVLEAVRPFATEADAEAFLNAPLRLRRQMVGQAQARVIGKKSLYATVENPQLEVWVEFYRKYFPLSFHQAGGEEALRDVRIPESREGFTRLIVVLKGLTMNLVFAECTRRFKTWRYTEDLDRNTPVNDRLPTESYAVWVRDRVEADEEYANLSANDLATRGVKCITRLERDLFELKFFDENGGHLDLKNVTLCAGSRCAGGRVPRARWYDGAFYVGWGGPSYRIPRLRVREVLC